MLLIDSLHTAHNPAAYFLINLAASWHQKLLHPFLKWANVACALLEKIKRDSKPAHPQEPINQKKNYKKNTFVRVHINTKNMMSHAIAR